MIKRRHLQQGLSFVELMVGMSLGTIILGGMLTVYMSSKQSYMDSDQVTMMDESARTALDTLTRHLEHAGYVSTTGIPLTNYVLPPTMTIVGENVAASSNVKVSKDGTGSSADQIGVRFKADSRLYTDCLESKLAETQRLCTGLAVNEKCTSTVLPPTASLIYNSFGINTNTERNIINATIPMLYCYGSISGTGQVIAQGVENMQVNYGIDNNHDKVADQYLNATQVEDLQLWNRILSIQVALLVRSRDPFYKDASRQTYQLLDKAIVSPLDKYRRGVYKTIIRLRNTEG